MLDHQQSPNLLVDNNWNVKVADFGLARFNIAKNEPSLAKLRGTYAYAAPETYSGQIYTTKSDVYSFGIILWELIMRLLTGCYHRPFSEYKNLRYDFQIIVQTAKKNLRPTFPATCPPKWQQLVESCWSHKQEDRPTLEEVLKSLAELKECCSTQMNQN